MDKVVHFELPADNIDRAKKFYKETFGWDIKDVPELDYTIIITSELGENQMPKNAGAINGGMIKRGDLDNVINGPAICVSVDNIDDAVKRIKNAGGLILKDKTQVGDVGMIAYFKDTEGNILEIWQPLKKMQ